MKKIIDYLPSEIVENEKIKLPSWCQKIKIDVGLSHNAPNSSEWLKNEENLYVLGIEPNQQAINIIKGVEPPPYESKYVLDKNLIGEKISIIPIALSDYNGESKFYSVKNNVDKNMNGYDLGSSSLHEPNFFEYQEVLVPIFKLSEILNLIDWSIFNKIDQVKIDAQGEDFKIVYGIGDLISKIVYISVETTTFNQYKKENNNLKEIDEFLKSKGFIIHKRTGTDTTFFNTIFEKDKDNILFSVLE